MTHTLQEAVALHRALPPEGWLALREAGLTDPVIHARLLGWDGEHIRIPVFSRGREVVAIERAEFSEDGVLVVLPNGDAPANLYNETLLESSPRTVIIAEDPAECLVLLAQRFEAVAMLGKSRTIPVQALEALYDVPEVFVCLRCGHESEAATARIADEIPDAFLVQFPDSFARGDGVGAFFTKHRKNRLAFLKLLTASAKFDGSY